MRKGEMETSVILKKCKKKTTNILSLVFMFQHDPHIFLAIETSYKSGDYI
jgi:hypothetical protein